MTESDWQRACYDDVAGQLAEARDEVERLRAHFLDADTLDVTPEEVAGMRAAFVEQKRLVALGRAVDECGYLIGNKVLLPGGRVTSSAQDLLRDIRLAAHRTEDATA